MSLDLGRGVAGGLAGTTVMTATTWLERVVRGPTDHPVDYDVSDHVVTAAAAVLRWQPSTAAQRRALFLLVHWGYGSTVGGGYELLRARLPRVPATAAFYALCQSMALILFPTLGRTPPPWRWRRDVLLSSLTQHLIYAATVAVVDTVLEGRSSP